MSHRTSVHDLKSLVLSFHSLIGVETVEEDRVRSLLMEVANDLKQTFDEWSLTSGSTRLRVATINGTQDPLAALHHIAEIENTDAIYLLKDMARHLENPNVSRALRELAQKLTSTRSALVLTGDPMELPADFEALAVRFRLEMPDVTELREVVRSVVDSISARQRVQIDLSRDDALRLVQALQGLTVNQARQVVAQAIVEDGRLSADDIQTIVRCKGEMIERGGILQFFPLEESSFEIGGFSPVRGRPRRAPCRFSPPARGRHLH